MNNVAELALPIGVEHVALSASLDRLEREFQAVCRRYNANLVVTLQNISSTEGKAGVEWLGSFEDMSAAGD